MSRLMPQWPIPAALIALILIPVAASVYRLADVTLAAPLAATARFHAAPVSILLHVTGASLFLILGLVQLMSGLRTRWRRWHRRAGKVALLAGLVAAVTGIWMTLTYPHAPEGSALLDAFRLVFGAGWALSLILAWRAIRRGAVPQHRAWMLRAYAIGMGAGTTILTFGLWYVLTGIDNAPATAWTQAAAWLLNLAVAEWAIRAIPSARPLAA